MTLHVLFQSNNLGVTLDICDNELSREPFIRFWLNQNTEYIGGFYCSNYVFHEYEAINIPNNWIVA